MLTVVFEQRQRRTPIHTILDPLCMLTGVVQNDCFPYIRVPARCLRQLCSKKAPNYSTRLLAYAYSWRVAKLECQNCPLGEYASAYSRAAGIYTHTYTYICIYTYLPCTPQPFAAQAFLVAHTFLFSKYCCSDGRWTGGCSNGRIQFRRALDVQEVRVRPRDV